MSETMELALAQPPQTREPAPWARAPGPMDLIRDALARGADLETIKELRSLAVEMDQWQARKAFDAAMAAAKAEIPPIAKNRTVDYNSTKGNTHYKHEDLAEIARTVDPILAKHGLSYRFRTKNAPNEPVTVICVIAHRDGYFEENSLSGPPDDSGNKNSHQRTGSAITYLQRYTLKAALGLAASNDDDGRKAGEAEEPATITDEQVAEIQRRIVETDTDIPTFLRFFDVERLSDLPSKRYDEAARMLARKAAKMAKDAAGTEDAS